MSAPDATPPALEPATLRRRFAAFVYDALVLVGVIMTYTLIVVLARGAREVEPGTWWFLPSLIALTAFFYAWFWTRGGQTLGMRSWRLQLVSLDGEPIGWRRALVRVAAAWLAALPLGAGYWWKFFDKDRLCWHDRLSKTVPITLPKRPKRPKRTAKSGPDAGAGVDSASS